MNLKIQSSSLIKSPAPLSSSLTLASITQASQIVSAEPVAGNGIPFLQEVENYLFKYPGTKHVDIYINDISGAFRGKRVTVASLKSLEKGVYFPQSVYSMDKEGKVMSAADNNLAENEPDRMCIPVSGTLRPCGHNPAENAQILLTMQDEQGEPYELEPRVILTQVLSKFHAHGLYPVIAPEIEFYLEDSQNRNIQSSGCFHLAVPSEHTAFIEELENMATMQNLPLSGIVCEAEAGQFELNLQHSQNVVDICENILALRRLTSTVAHKFGFNANFMAKPYSGMSGSGLHFHISLHDVQGNNIFASPDENLNEMMRLSLAGMLHLMPASIAIMAPNVNSFRRLRKNLNEPLFSSWGVNQRSAALRIPCSEERHRRIEYRLAGSDANPYLAVATILTGMLYGLEKIEDEPLTDFTACSPVLPLFQQHALDEFRQSPYLTAALGEAFSKQWIQTRLAELALFESIVTPGEHIVSY
ncbi:glutamine synthetase family protein [Rahnella bonaserana]|jgi:gamma-glutamylputrescine synthase|uniref:Glutamine synthetase n=1 Tax=Rahnella bonaserana TaxID=2816248 RepID=A0ABS6LWY1_9GAMM|nr:glutamine synthetase family protein [Rahnella bonaserana]MBU9856589.1 glutamine synthetase [Rahnella bonaserana]MCL9643835.1 glutamine synthetase family protein [Rahnella victoriana]WHZ42749.1 glutamine synthetase family protein [Rahnella bonaserana]